MSFFSREESQFLRAEIFGSNMFGLGWKGKACSGGAGLFEVVVGLVAGSATL